jgi:hypothetical protein
MSDSPVLDTIRHSFGRVVYTYKTHEKQIDRLAASLKRYKWTRLVIVALTATGAISTLTALPGWTLEATKLATAILATISLALTIYGLSFNPEEAIQRHRSTANDLWCVREEYCNLIADIVSERIGDDRAAQIRDDLTRRLEIIYHNAPHTSPQAYTAAQQALKVSQEMTFTDEEIDSFLSPTLRKTKLLP